MVKSALYKKYYLAWNDIADGLKSWRIWLLLAWHAVKLRYRRSTLGPFWITISMAITIYTMGILYGHLFKINLAVYYPFLATGILGWNLISLIVNGSGRAAKGCSASTRRTWSTTCSRPASRARPPSPRRPRSGS